jgi:solute carrier family 25 S-adenosylmethionine transporter 26
MIIGEEDNTSAATSPELIAAAVAKTTDDQQPSIINSFQEIISGFVSGSVVSIAKTIIKYPLDTATVRLQMPNTKYTLLDLPALFDGSFDGITAPLLSNIPSSGVFFAVKDVTKSVLKYSSFGGSDLPKWVTTALAVGAAQPLYWALRNPSEVIKTRLQVGTEGYYEGMSTVDAFKLVINGTNGRGGGVDELFRGYSENILYAYPADLIKFGAYEFLSEIGKGKQNKNKKIVVSPVEGAIYGALSTGVAQLVTTPLDVIRNRIMAANGEKEEKEDARDAATTIQPSYIERLTTIAREEGIGVLFAGSFPRLGKALLSGAIQFATYEETKQKMGEFFIKR